MRRGAAALCDDALDASVSEPSCMPSGHRPQATPTLHAAGNVPFVVEKEN